MYPSGACCKKTTPIMATTMPASTATIQGFPVIMLHPGAR
jgi:hypothetical protein